MAALRRMRAKAGSTHAGPLLPQTPTLTRAQGPRDTRDASDASSRALQRHRTDDGDGTPGVGGTTVDGGQQVDGDDNALSDAESDFDDDLASVLSGAPSFISELASRRRSRSASSATVIGIDVEPPLELHPHEIAGESDEEAAAADPATAGLDTLSDAGSAWSSASSAVTRGDDDAFHRPAALMGDFMALAHGVAPLRDPRATAEEEGGGAGGGVMFGNPYRRARRRQQRRRRGLPAPEGSGGVGGDREQELEGGDGDPDLLEQAMAMDGIVAGVGGAGDLQGTRLSRSGSSRRDTRRTGKGKGKSEGKRAGASGGGEEIDGANGSSDSDSNSDSESSSSSEEEEEDVS